MPETTWQPFRKRKLGRDASRTLCPPYGHTPHYGRREGFPCDVGVLLGPGMRPIPSRCFYACYTLQRSSGVLASRISLESGATRGRPFLRLTPNMPPHASRRLPPVPLHPLALRFTLHAAVLTLVFHGIGAGTAVVELLRFFP